MSRLHIWSVGNGELHTVTSEFFDAYYPAWDTEGNYLFYLSDRHYAPQISDLEWNFAGNLRGGIYSMTLRRDVKPLFPPKSDEVEVKKKEEKEIAAPAKEEDIVEEKKEEEGAPEEKMEEATEEKEEPEEEQKKGGEEPEEKKEKNKEDLESVETSKEDK